MYVVALSMLYIIKSYRCHFLLTDISNAKLEKEVFIKISFWDPPKIYPDRKFQLLFTQGKVGQVCKQNDREVSVAMMVGTRCLSGYWDCNMQSTFLLGTQVLILLLLIDFVHTINLFVFQGPYNIQSLLV